jgi:hypothetical protein
VILIKLLTPLKNIWNTTPIQIIQNLQWTGYKTISSGGGYTSSASAKAPKEDDLTDFSMDEDSDDVFSFDDKPAPKRRDKARFQF